MLLVLLEVRIAPSSERFRQVHAFRQSPIAAGLLGGRIPLPIQCCCVFRLTSASVPEHPKSGLLNGYTKDRVIVLCAAGRARGCFSAKIAFVPHVPQVVSFLNNTV